MYIVKISRLQVDKKTSKKTKIQAFYWNYKKVLRQNSKWKPRGVQKILIGITESTLGKMHKY